MKNLIYFCSTILILSLALTTFIYSQWTISGTLANLGGTSNFASISVASPDIVWVAGGPPGTPVVHKTTNGGMNWTQTGTTGLGSLELYCVWGVDENTAFVGNGGGAGGTGGNATYYKTTDGGATWTAVSSTGGSGGFFNGIVFSRVNPMFGIAQSDPPNLSGQPYYVPKTTDGGATWTVTNPPGVPGAASAQNSIMIIDDQFYGFGLNAGAARVYMTSNGGANWFIGNTGLPGAAVFMSGFAFSDNKLHGIAAGSATLPSIARTTDGGLTWSVVNTGAGLTGYCTTKWVNLTNTCYISGAAGGAGVVRKSTDGGVTWTTMSTSGITGITHMEFIRVGNVAHGYALASGGTSSIVLKVSDLVTDINNNIFSVPFEYKLEQNYPNPFNPSTTINYSLPKSAKVTLIVYDALGQEVSTLVNGHREAGNHTERFIADGKLTSGVYFYKLTAGDFTDTKKLMLLK
jgi:photosystem II stability/assembly factor-like uncharacterized protein